MNRKEDTVPTTSKKIRRVTRSDVTEFSWKTHCFYYGYPCVPDPIHPTRKKTPKLLCIAFQAECTKNV